MKKGDERTFDESCVATIEGGITVSISAYHVKYASMFERSKKSEKGEINAKHNPYDSIPF